MRVLLEQGGQLPIRGNVGDAGFDIFVSEDTVIPANSFHLVPSSIRIQLPDDMWYLILGRSSTSNKRGLIVIPAVIDAGYRGPLYANIFNPQPRDILVEAGDRLVQIVPFDLLAHRLSPAPVDALDVSDRGENGFGSSGH